MELQPSYYAVIPANVRYDKTLPPLARLMYAEITALSNQYGYCFATNKYFAELYEVTDRTVRNWIESLTEKGYISKSYVVIGNKKRRILSINPHAVTVPGNPLEVIEKLEEEELESQGGKKFPQGRKIISAIILQVILIIIYITRVRARYHKRELLTRAKIKKITNS